MKLELMDWKTVEREAEVGLRQGLIMIEINTEILKKAKKNIKNLGGSISEEEAAESKKKIEKERKNTIAS